MDILKSTTDACGVARHLKVLGYPTAEEIEAQRKWREGAPAADDSSSTTSIVFLELVLMREDRRPKLE